MSLMDVSPRLDNQFDVGLTDEEAERVRALAKKYNCPRSRVIRQAVVEFLERTDAEDPPSPSKKKRSKK